MKKNNLFVWALPGVAISFLLSYAGFVFSNAHPLLDAFFIAFIGGVVVGNFIKKKSLLWMGVGLCKDVLIPVGLFLYGAQLNMHDWVNVEFRIFVFALINIFAYFTVILACNKYLFKITDNKLSYMNAGANSICGVSATAVFIPFVEANDEEVSATLIAIVVTGLISVFATWMIIKNFFAGISVEKYAAICALTLNQTGAVKTAAGFMGQEAVRIASTIKYFRTSMIIPAALILMFLNQHMPGRRSKMPAEIRRSVVNYGFFIAMLYFGGSFLFSGPLYGYSAGVKPWFVILFGMALASIGLLCDVRQIFRKDVFLNTLSALIAWLCVFFITLSLVSRFL